MLTVSLMKESSSCHSNSEERKTSVSNELATLVGTIILYQECNYLHYGAQFFFIPGM